MTIKDTEERYVAAWTNYIDELTHLALSAEVEWDEFEKVKAQLRNWVAAAVSNLNFKETKNDIP